VEDPLGVRELIDDTLIGSSWRSWHVSGDPAPEPYRSLLNTTAVGQLEQVAAAVENLEIANLKRLQFCWFAGKRTPRSRKTFCRRSKGTEGIDRVAFRPQIPMSRRLWLKGPEGQRFVG
jgi:hypothetical protein